MRHHQCHATVPYAVIVLLERFKCNWLDHSMQFLQRSCRALMMTKQLDLWLSVSNWWQRWRHLQFLRLTNPNFYNSKNSNLNVILCYVYQNKTLKYRPHFIGVSIVAMFRSGSRVSGYPGLSPETSMYVSEYMGYTSNKMYKSYIGKETSTVFILNTQGSIAYTYFKELLHAFTPHLQNCINNVMKLPFKYKI